MNKQERQNYINDLKNDIIKIRRQQLDNKYSPERFKIYKESNKHLLWLKENGMLQSTFLKNWIKIPQDLLDYIDNNKETKNANNE